MIEELKNALLKFNDRLKELERVRSAPTLTWIAPTYTNSWVNYGGGTYNDGGYTRDQRNFVLLRGLLKTGTVNTSMFTLPAGYRPLKTLVFPVVSNSAFGIVLVNSSGNVILTVGSNVSASLDGIAFIAEA